MPRVICPNCSNPYTPPAGGVERCPRCGYGVAEPGVTASPRLPALSAPSFSPALSPPGPALAPPGSAPTGAPPGTNGLAVTSMVLGIVSIPFFMLGLLALLGLVFGVVALTQVRRKNQRGFGMAVAGVVLSSLSLAFVLFFWFAVMAVF